MATYYKEIVPDIAKYLTIKVDTDTSPNYHYIGLSEKLDVTDAETEWLVLKEWNDGGVITVLSADGSFEQVSAWADRDSYSWPAVVDPQPLSTSASSVDVTAVVPGTGSTNLGKAEDAAHASGHVGVMSLGVRNDAGTAFAADGDYVPLSIDAAGALRVTGGGGGTEYTTNAVVPANPVGTTLVSERDDQLSTLTEVEGDWTNTRATSKGALWVAMADAAGDPIESFGGGTQYTEDAAAAANPVGNAQILVRADSLAGVTTTDGDNVAARGTDKGEMYVKHVDAIPVTDNGGTLTVDNAALSVTGGGVEATALRVTIATDSTGVVSVDDNGASLTVDNAALSVTGGGVEASALRVTIANDSTGVLSVDDNGGSLTVDGTVTANAGTNLNTSLLALESGGNLAAAAASLSVLDDWDETNRGAVNTIAGQVGVQGASGAVTALTQRVVLATDVALPTGTNSIGQVTANAGTNLNTSLLALESGGNLAAAAASLSVLDDWDETNRGAVNTIAGQVGVQGASGTVTALTQRVVLATDVALPAGTNNIGDVDVLSVVPGTTATSLGKAEDAAHTSGDVGVMALAVRDDAGNPFGADGDYVPLSTDSSGALRVTGGGGGTEYTVNAVVPSDPVGTTLVMERDDQLSTVTEAAGDWTNARGTALGALWVAIADASGDPITSFGGGTQYTEDAAAAANPVGNAQILVRADSLAGVTTTDGDNVATRGTDKGEMYVKHVDAIPVTDNGGALTVDNGGTFAVQISAAVPGTGATNLGKAEDAAHSSGDVGVMALAVRNDAGAAFAADGDYVPLSIDSAGALRVTGGGGGTQYTEGDTDASITGSALLWEGGGDTLTTVATATPLPVVQTGTLNIGTVTTVTTVSAVTAISNALPAGNNNIGDVDVASIVPGTGATNLGKAEDAAHTSGDVGVMVLGVRNDAGTALAADGDYIPLSIDSAGAVRVTGGGGGTQYTEGDTDASITGTAILWEGAADTLTTVATATPLPVVQTGTLNVGTVTTVSAVTAISNALPAGNNNIGDVDVASVVPGTGATNLGKAIDTALGATDTVVVAGTVRDDALTTLTEADGDVSALRVTSVGRLWVSSALDSAIPAGTNNIGDVDVLSVVPGTGATALGKAIDTALGATDTGVLALTVRDDALATLTEADGDVSALRVGSTGRLWTSAAARTTDTMSSALATDAIMEGTTVLTPKFAIIDAATSGDNTLVASVSGKKIRVLSLYIVASAAVNVRFESGASGTALSGQMNLAANGGFTLPFNPVGWFETAATTLLNLELSGAISVDGGLQYVEVS